MTLHVSSSPLSLTCQCLWSWAIVMHMEPYVCGIQSKCQLTKALCYHQALWILSLFCVTLDSILYIVTIWSLSLEVSIPSVCLCPCCVCLQKCESMKGLWVHPLPLLIYTLFQPPCQLSSKSHSRTNSSQTTTNCNCVTTTTHPPLQYFMANTISRGQQYLSNTCHCILHSVLNPLNPPAGLLNTVFIYPDVLLCAGLRCLVKCHSFSALITEAYGTLLSQ